jgi:two-component system phosphate regulon sensor histidine kinase PhoR
MVRLTLFWKLLIALVLMTTLLSWVQARARLSVIGDFMLLVAMATAASVMLARYLARPLDRMRRAAQAQAAGEPNVEWPIPTTREMRALSNAVQTMAINLQDKIRTIEGLLAEQRAIFDSMAEGLLVIDPRERLLDANRAAQQMFGFDIASARGREMLEVIRNARLAELLRRTLRGEEPVVEGQLTLLGDKERHLQTRGSILRTGARVKGALLVLTDVTHLRKLETLQREFVANASHELKTPVTSIKGFAETLAAEEMDPEQARRFSRIILRQAEQLGTLIDDLLELTRLEYEDGHAALERAPVLVSDIVDNALETCALEANQKDIRVEREVPGDLKIFAHAVLLQRAVFNLLDNAIKYSPAHSTVRIRARSEGDEVSIAVIDEGPGIAPEHHARIFERFYRVDKSRSRKLGGTGLGLSIVKHVVLAHGGRVDLESAPGKGSAFIIRIPTPPEPGGRRQSANADENRGGETRRAVRS